MRKKFLKITIVAVLIIAMLNGIVNAFSFTATMTPSSTNVDPSAEFTIMLPMEETSVRLYKHKARQIFPVSCAMT